MTDNDRRHLRGLDIGMLRTFDALMRERSVSRAATRLFLSQPAVSGSLARLRQTFGDPLFKRSGHGVTPTPLALSMAGPVAQLLADMGRLLDAGRAFDPAASDRIFRIAGSDYSSRMILTPLLAGLQALHSTVRIAWEPPSFNTLPERLRHGDVDLACAPLPSMPAGLPSALLFEEHFVLVARKGHPKLLQGDVFEAFCSSPHVFFGYRDPSFQSALDASLDSQGRRCFVQLRMPSFDQAADVVMHTDMVSVFPSRLARCFADRLDSFPLPVAIDAYQSRLYWDRSTTDDPGLCWLREQILQVARSVDAAG
jgi:DNA-binding transcriptional LysR family regulator